LKSKLSEYDHEIIFIDNCSKDNSRNIIRELAKNNDKIRAIFNTKNFGGLKSPYYGLTQTTGDCSVLLCADFQDPIELIYDFVKEWEKGFKIVIGIKNKSKENKLMYFIRTCYYKIIKYISETEQIPHFTGFGLYDKNFIKILRNLNEPLPYLRGIVTELGYSIKKIYYVQPRRLHGKTSTNFYWLFNVAMIGITSNSKIILRLATILGFAFSGIGFVISMIYLVLKFIYWNSFTMGMAPVLIGVFLFSSIQLFFIGLLGEYILSINERIMNRPLVIEEERINFNK
jgi:glycosyltransferase involved in cell wall biosynthesis